MENFAQVSVSCMKKYLPKVIHKLTNDEIDKYMTVVENKYDVNEIAHVILLNDKYRHGFVELVNTYISLTFSIVLDKDERTRKETVIHNLFVKYYNPTNKDFVRHIKKYLELHRPPVGKCPVFYVNEKVLNKIQKKMELYIDKKVIPNISVHEISEICLYEEDDPIEVATILLNKEVYLKGFESLLEEYTFQVFPTIISLSQYRDKMEIIDMIQKRMYTPMHKNLQIYVKRLMGLPTI